MLVLEGPSEGAKDDAPQEGHSGHYRRARARQGDGGGQPCETWSDDEAEYNQRTDEIMMVLHRNDTLSGCSRGARLVRLGW